MLLFFYLPIEWNRIAACSIFVIASITDILDGYFARKHQTHSRFGAFLDPVADKLTVTTALVILLQDNPTIPMMIATAIIIGRELTISALREWMAELGERTAVGVATIGKLKTIFQMTAISFLLLANPTVNKPQFDIQQLEVLQLDKPLFGLPIYEIGLSLLYIAALLTLWSMFVYLKAAWPMMKEKI